MHVTPTHAPKIIDFPDLEGQNLRSSTVHIRGHTKPPFQSCGPPTFQPKWYCFGPHAFRYSRATIYIVLTCENVQFIVGAWCAFLKIRPITEAKQTSVFDTKMNSIPDMAPTFHGPNVVRNYPERLPQAWDPYLYTYTKVSRGGWQG